MIFKGKWKLKFRALKEVQITVQDKGWMDSSLMIQWFRHCVMPYTQGRLALLIVDSFLAHGTEEFIDMTHKNNVDLAITYQYIQSSWCNAINSQYHSME